MTNNNKDWSSNSKSVSSSSGFGSHSEKDRVDNDYYATHPIAITELFKLEQFNNLIIEPSCGEGHLTQEMERLGKQVIRYDLIDREQIDGGTMQTQDFFQDNNYPQESFDLITNPPYKFANNWIVKSLEILKEGDRVALFLPIRYLESKGRRKIFQNNPPQIVYVSSGRIPCARNGNFGVIADNAVSYCWMIWKKGYSGETILKWFN